MNVVVALHDGKHLTNRCESLITHKSVYKSCAMSIVAYGTPATEFKVSKEYVFWHVRVSASDAPKFGLGESAISFTSRRFCQHYLQVVCKSDKEAEQDLHTKLKALEYKFPSSMSSTVKYTFPQLFGWGFNKIRLEGKQSAELFPTKEGGPTGHTAELTDVVWADNFVSLLLNAKIKNDSPDWKTARPPLQSVFLRPIETKRSMSTVIQQQRGVRVDHAWMQQVLPMCLTAHFELVRDLNGQSKYMGLLGSVHTGLSFGQTNAIPSAAQLTQILLDNDQFKQHPALDVKAPSRVLFLPFHSQSGTHWRLLILSSYKSQRHILFWDPLGVDIEHSGDILIWDTLRARYQTSLDAKERYKMDKVPKRIQVATDSTSCGPLVIWGSCMYLRWLLDDFAATDSVLKTPHFFASSTTPGSQVPALFAGKTDTFHVMRESQRDDTKRNESNARVAESMRDSMNRLLARFSPDASDLFQGQEPSASSRTSGKSKMTGVTSTASSV